MQFRDLRVQYLAMKENIDTAIAKVIENSNFISGRQVSDLERALEQFVGVKHCITCGNGTDALTLALKAWNIKQGDAVFVPDFTFFASGEVVSFEGATPIFVDVESDTYNISPGKLEEAILRVKKEGKQNPRVIIAVDLFGQPADYTRIRNIADKYGLLILEDGAQGFGGRIGERRACSFGDISTTSFFPAKPLGCYGDGGAVFTDNDEWAERMRSLRIHGKGDNKYDNVRIGMNSRLDTLQAAVLLAKLPVFESDELDRVNIVTARYNELLCDTVVTPIVKEGFYSSWAQYTIQLENKKQRDNLQIYLKEKGIPSMIYYSKAMHRQQAFSNVPSDDRYFPNTLQLCKTVLSLPLHPYMLKKDIEEVANAVREGINEKPNPPAMLGRIG